MRYTQNHDKRISNSNEHEQNSGTSLKLKLQAHVQAEVHKKHDPSVKKGSQLYTYTVQGVNSAYYKKVYPDTHVRAGASTARAIRWPYEALFACSMCGFKAKIHSTLQSNQHPAGRHHH